MAVGMILACLAFAVAATVEIKINVSTINLKPWGQDHTYFVHFSDLFNLDFLGPKHSTCFKEGA